MRKLLFTLLAVLLSTLVAQADPNMPFKTTTLTTAGTFSTDTRWYTLQISASGLYVTGNTTATSITLSKSTTELDDADLWCFVGDAEKGYKIYNKAAGTSHVLAAPATLSTHDAGGSSYPMLRQESSLETWRPYWRFATSTDLGEQTAYYMYPDGQPSHKLNKRGDKLSFWTGGADAGSAFQVKFAEEKLLIDLTTGSYAPGTSANYRKTWNSTSTDPTRVSLDAGYNNMTTQGTNIVAYVGRYSPQAYTISAGKGFTVAAFSFDFANFGTAEESITVSAGEQTLTSSASQQSLSVDGLKEQAATFTLSGQNKGIVLTNFWVTVKASLVAPEPQFNVFETRSGQTPYRIPAIAKAHNGNLIAVADYRHTGADIGMVPNGRLDLHARISKDNGKTWGEKFSVVDGLGGDNGFHTAFGDPCIVGDRESNRVLILSCAGNVSFFNGTRQNHQGIAYFLSEDNGETWSSPIDLEAQFYEPLDGSSRGPVRAMFIGSGKIHQSRYTKVGDYYRLYCATLTKDVNGTYTNYVYYSDDFGRNWQLLGDPNFPAIPSGTDEPKVEELPDGSIVCSGRASGGRLYNIFSFTDCAQGKGYWGSVAFSGSKNKGTVALGNSTNGEIFILPATRKSDGKVVYLALQSVPFGSGRNNVGIYYKELASFADYGTPAAFAANWKGRHQASYMGSAYSTMCLQNDNTLAFLFEESTLGADYTIVYKNYSLEHITDSLYSFNNSLEHTPFLTEAAQSLVNATIDGAGEYVGMFDATKGTELQTALTELQTSPSFAAYERINAFIATNTVPLKMDKFYTLRSRQYSTFLTPRPSDNAFTGVAAQGDDQKFLTVDKGDGTFSLYHPLTKKWLGPTVALYQFVKMVDEGQAGVFKLVSSHDGNSALVCTTPANPGYPAIHLSGENNLVSWTVDAEASHWNIAQVEVPTQISALPIDATKADDAIFDLQGRRVTATPRRGVYIVGRKKVVF